MPGENMFLYFLKGKRQLTVYHARIRNKCSDLKFDIFNNHVSESHLCTCGYGSEDAEHCFLKCNIYQNQRIAIFNATRSFHPLSVNALLFGKNITDDENSTNFH